MKKETPWAQRIQWCLDSGMSQTDIAQLCGLERSTLNDLHKERSKQPRGMAAVRLYRLSEKHRPKEISA